MWMLKMLWRTRTHQAVRDAGFEFKPDCFSCMNRPSSNAKALSCFLTAHPYEIYQERKEKGDADKRTTTMLLARIQGVREFVLSSS